MWRSNIAFNLFNLISLTITQKIMLILFYYYLKDDYY